MERVLQLFESLGYPRRGTNWLRHRRGWVIIVLALLAWVTAIAFGFACAYLLMEVTTLVVS